VTVLENSRDELAVSLKQRVALLREIHHRVKNNLQIISYLLSLQAQTVGNAEYSNLIQESINRIQSMAAVHEILYETKNFSHLDLGAYLRSIAEHLIGFYSMNMRNITINFDMQEVFFPMEKAVNCGLVITELMTNALKYAFPGNRKGTITLTLRDGKMVTLLFEDDGIGLPPGVFEDDDRTVKSKCHLGLLLVKSLTAQMGGTISYSGERGTSFRIELP